MKINICYEFIIKISYIILMLIFNNNKKSGKPPREWGAGLMSVLPQAKKYIISQEFYVKENLEAW